MQSYSKLTISRYTASDHRLRLGVLDSHWQSITTPRETLTYSVEIKRHTGGATGMCLTENDCASTRTSFSCEYRD